jgi:hypothetical protein
MRAAPISYARAVYEIASYMIECHGERAGDVLKEFVAVNQSDEDIETSTLWADVIVAVRNLTSDAVPPRTASSKGRGLANCRS